MELFRRNRRTQASRGRTFLYVSDSKVDMLIDDLGPSLREQFDLKVKAGVPKVLEGEVGLRQVQVGRYARAQRLCDALEKDEQVGSIHEGKRFIRGKMLAAWGFWNRYDKGYADVVFFHGFPDANTFVGIGGSAYHTMEREGERLQQYSNSGIQMLMEFLRERSRHAGSYRHQPPGAWPAEAWEADHDNSAVPEPIEFVAERYLDDPDRGIRTIIGHPIYVARSGEPLSRSSLQEYEALRNEYAIRVLSGKPRNKKRSGRREIGKPSWPQLAPIEEPKTTEAADT